MRFPINLTPGFALAVALLLFAGPASAATGDASEAVPLNAEDFIQVFRAERDQQAVGRAVRSRLQRNHFRDLSLDDELSKMLFEAYLDELDPNRHFFYANDVERLRVQLEDQLDDSLKQGNLAAAYWVFNLYHRRSIERLVEVINTLPEIVAELDFDVAETIDLDRSDDGWPVDDAQMDAAWRKRIKSAALNLVLAGKDRDEVAELLSQRYRTQLRRSSQLTGSDVFSIYINSFAKLYDPHTQYYSPRNTENFNIAMSLSLEGIGAVLQSEDEFTKVTNIVPGGPADLSGRLHADDRIIGVGQGTNGEIQEVIGWRLDDVVDLIRGPKGSVVKLEIIPAGNTTSDASRVIQIERNEVKLEEQAAKSEILELDHLGRSWRVGVIDLPTFYVDFAALQAGKEDYRSTTRDVRRLIRDLKAAEVDALVVDLRNNRGGSLQEANSMVGLFIDQGPVVQIRSSRDRVQVLRDSDPGLAWDGPLAVLINRFSASASEIFAGAVQDYGRGVVLGDQSFGKGTVQTLVPIDAGQLKITQAKFYRVSGRSTQNRGITPDISFPSPAAGSETGERALPRALPWDVIGPADFQGDDHIDAHLSSLRSRHSRRAANDPDFVYLTKQARRLAEQNQETTVSLNKAERLAEDEAEERWRLSVENERRKARGLAPLEALPEDERLGTLEFEDDEVDPMLRESGFILLDLIDLSQQQAIAGGGAK